MTGIRLPVSALSAIVSLIILILPCPAGAGDAPFDLQLVPDQVKQGGIATLWVHGAAPTEPVRVRVGSWELVSGPAMADAPRLLWIGVDLEEAPGPKEIVAAGIAVTDRPATARARLLVLGGGYPVQHLTVPRTFTELDAATLERTAREKAMLDRLWETATPTRLWRGPFRSPLDGSARAAGFGLKRIINGEPRAPHTGVDFSAPAGAPVLAANAGTVALSEEHFFAGNSLVLDHGEGLYTMYFHLQERLVRPGQRVVAGEMVGRVGSTGRATGPHLHWGARLLGARINPEELLRLRPE
jgi:murein DD-endopeptidase MepM/ murein hydrolase activator NlpD